MSGTTIPNVEMFRLRRRKGLSRDMLGALAGISGKQIGLIERGIARFSTEDTHRAIANALDADIDDLFPPERLLVGRSRPKKKKAEPEKAAA